MTSEVAPFTTADFDDEDAEAGIRLSDFSRAVSIWSAMQLRDVSVAETALAFNATPDVVQRAVREHGGPYLYLIGDETDPAKQFIEHDGE
ncbi:hypothetical protein [Kaistia sp. 32K]|uniref:hypothetical protein n=1 Tax=Kaistia sp. 32K TaxID=2795690 RepID=UPI0019150EC8|nr:hypothetical protein [Kaistia sp. 32K]